MNEPFTHCKGKLMPPSIEQVAILSLNGLKASGEHIILLNVGLTCKQCADQKCVAACLLGIIPAAGCG